MEGWVEGLEAKVIIGVIVGDDDTNTFSDGLDEDFIDGLDEENDTGSGGGALSKIPKHVSL
jgi:TolB-like protein